VNAIELSFSLNPSTAEPGQDVDVDIDVINRPNVSTGSDIKDYNNVEINFLESYPFHLKRKSQSITEPFYLCSSCTKKGTFYLSVDPQASSNVYPLFFELKYGTTISNEKVFAEVKGFPNIVFDTHLLKSNLKPRDKFNISLQLTNVGSGLAKTIKISQDSTDFIMEGDNLVFLDELISKQSKTVILTFLVNEKIKPGAYLLPIKVSTEDSRRNHFNFTQSIGLNILHKAKINIRNLKVSRDGNVYDIRLRVENVGKGEANDITAELLTKYEGFKKNYIGKLNTDEDLPIIFTLNIGGNAKQSIPLAIKYNDDFGDYTLNENIEFEIPSPFGILTYVSIILPVVLLILILVFFIIRRRRHHSET